MCPEHAPVTVNRLEVDSLAGCAGRSAASLKSPDAMEGLLMSTQLPRVLKETTLTAEQLPPAKTVFCFFLSESMSEGRRKQNQVCHVRFFIMAITLFLSSAVYPPFG